MNITYRKATLADKKSLWHFYESAYNDKVEFLKDPYWSWLNIDNPLQKDKIATNTYIAVDVEANKIAGHYTVIPQNFYANGHQIQFSWGINLFVDKAYRGQGIAKKLQTLLIEKHDIYTAISIAASTRKMILNMEGAVVLPDTFTLSLALNPDKDFLLSQQIKNYQTDAVLYPLAAVLKKSSKIKRLVKHLLTHSLYKKTNALLSDRVSPDSFDSIAKSNITDPSFLQIRSEIKQYFCACPDDSPDYLKWKFERHPVKKYKLFTYNEGSEAKAYVILRMGIAPEQNIGIISEIFANSDKHLHELIAFTKAYFLEKKCLAVHVIAQHPQYVKAFKKAGFLITNKRKPVALARKRDSIAFLEKIKTWYFTFESQDLDFYPNTRI